MKLKASFSVEAALIVSVVIGFLFSAVYYPGVLHDRVLERTSLTLVLNRAAGGDPASLTEEEEDAGRILSGRIFSGGNSLKIEEDGYFLQGSAGDYHEERRTLRPEEMMRKVTLLEEIIP